MSVVAQLVRRAERAGFKAIALTVDTLRLGRREADIKNRFTLPPFLTLKNFEGLDLGKMDKADDFGLASNVVGQIDRTLSWKDVKWLQTITKLPILVKGVLTTVDTRIVVQSGAARIIDNSIAYWRKFVAEYYSPRAKKRWHLSLYSNVGHHALGVLPQATMDA
eukprot:XP_006605117.1 peroxisomal (S)-2-hydroxy-acid oxidase GLO5-like [Glycine max]